MGKFIQGHAFTCECADCQIAQHYRRLQGMGQLYDTTQMKQAEPIEDESVKQIEWKRPRTESFFRRLLSLIKESK